MARASSLVLAAALMWLPAGCSIVDLVTPEPRTAGAEVIVTIEERDSISVQITGSLRAGIDAQGNVRSLIDAGLLVNGQDVQPARIDIEGNYTFETRLNAFSVRTGEIAIRLPSIVGLEGEPAEYILPVLRRRGPRDVQPLDGSLVFELEPAPLEVLPESIIWDLDLAATCSPSASSLLNLSSRRPPPPVLTISKQLVESLPATAFEACFLLRASHLERDAQYTAGFQLRNSTSWRVRR